MIYDRNRKRREEVFRRTPVERTHREIIVFPVPDSKLFLEVLKGEGLVVSIEILVVFSVAALHLAVVPESINTNELKPDILRKKALRLLNNTDLGKRVSTRKKCPLQLWTTLLLTVSFLKTFPISPYLLDASSVSELNEFFANFSRTAAKALAIPFCLFYNMLIGLLGKS